MPLQPSHSAHVRSLECMPPLQSGGVAAALQKVLCLRPVSDIDHLIRTIPKAELHIHIEGSLEPELMFEIARRNSVSLRYKSVDDLRSAYEFTDLQSFLDIYYEGASVLRQERD